MTRPVLIFEDGSILDRRGLDDLVGRFMRVMESSTKLLVCILGDRELGSVVAYLAATRLGHTVAWFGPAGLEKGSNIVERFEPDLVLVPAVIRATFSMPDAMLLDVPTPDVALLRAERRRRDLAPIHEGTRLLLPTSGSTGRSKVARLSSTALESNISAICEALDIGPGDRAATSLPLTYCYGLSVLLSHVEAGASVLLTTASPISGAFWRQFGSSRCTTLPAVPFHLKWLTSGAGRARAIETAQVVTSSGGELPREVARLTRAAIAAGGRGLYEMYGQTEASSRISVLRPDDAESHPGSVGSPVPGLKVQIEDDGGKVRPGQRGDIVCYGPSVMLGYATCRKELSAPDELHGRLVTGDVGRIEGGFLYVMGRRGRFYKPLGSRVDLDETERLLRDDGSAAAVAVDAQHAVVFVEGERSSDGPRRRDALRRFGLAPEHLRVELSPSLPRSPSGKVDYPRLVSRAQQLLSCTTTIDSPLSEENA